MDNIKGDKYFAKKAIENINIIKNYLANKDYNEFVTDDQLVDAVMFRLIQLVENIKGISINFKIINPQIPWGKIIGFRNGIVHEYGKTDYQIVYETVTNDLDDLLTLLNSIQ